jgi:hypothetical protein
MTHSLDDYYKFRDALQPVKFQDTWTMSGSFKDLRKMMKLKFTVKHRGKESGKLIPQSKGFQVLIPFFYRRKDLHHQGVLFRLQIWQGGRTCQECHLCYA